MRIDNKNIYLYVTLIMSLYIQIIIAKYIINYNNIIIISITNN